MHLLINNLKHSFEALLLKSKVIKCYRRPLSIGRSISKFGNAIVKHCNRKKCHFCDRSLTTVSIKNIIIHPTSLKNTNIITCEDYNAVFLTITRKSEIQHVVPALSTLYSVTEDEIFQYCQFFPIIVMDPKDGIYLLNTMTEIIRNMIKN